MRLLAAQEDGEALQACGSRQERSAFLTDLRPIAVTAFLDWNSQIHGARLLHGARLPRLDAIRLAQRTLEYVGRVIGRTLARAKEGARFDVTLRVYHGWHKGFEQSDNRRALANAAACIDFAALSCKANVQIRADLSYGDRLLSALELRLHRRLGIHLPDTLRRDHLTNRLEEKMVDTALASDVVDLAHREPDRWIMVVGEDDDLVPPLFAAEAARGARGGRVLVVRTRTQGPFLNLSGLLEER